MKTNLLHAPDKFSVPPFANNPQSLVLDRDLQITGSKNAAKNHAAGALGDIDEAAHAGETPGKTAHMHVAHGIDFHRAEHRHIQAAPIVKIELGRLIDHG